MNDSNDPFVKTFLQAPLDQRLRITKDAANEKPLRALLGDDGYGEYRKLAVRASDHLSRADKTLIVVPGIMGSLLQSDSHGGIWWIDVRTRSYIDRLRLAPDGVHDGDPNDEIKPATTDITYDPFLSVLLERDEFGYTTFPYDWRKPPSVSAGALRDLIRKNYDTNGNNPVHVVAHSMGGVVLRETLAAYGDELRPFLGKIVFIATPHYGSGAIVGYLKNHLWGFDLMALLGLFLSRDTFRSLWGAIGLLPAPVGIYPGTRPGDPDPWKPDPNDRYAHPCANFDMYDAGEWKLDLDAEAQKRLQAALDAARAEHQRLFDAHANINPELRDKMLMIAGVGYPTLFRLRFDSKLWGLWNTTEKITSRIENDRHRDGDGSVPVASAMLERVETRYVRGEHGGMPNIPAVYEDVFHWLKGDALKLPDTPAGALSNHLAIPDVSEAPAIDGSANIPADGLGRWNPADPDPAKFEALKAQLDAEMLPAFSRVRLL